MNRKMKRLTWLAAALFAVLTAVPAMAHDTPGIKHTHPFGQGGYTQQREYRGVNNELGDILIMQAPRYRLYQSAPNGQFVMPDPITKAPPLTPNMKPKPINDPSLQYDKKTTKDYGKQ